MLQAWKMHAPPGDSPSEGTNARPKEKDRDAKKSRTEAMHTILSPSCLRFARGRRKYAYKTARDPPILKLDDKVAKKDKTMAFSEFIVGQASPLVLNIPNNIYAFGSYLRITSSCLFSSLKTTLLRSNLSERPYLVDSRHGDDKHINHPCRGSPMFASQSIISV